MAAASTPKHQISDPNRWLEQYGDTLYRYALARTQGSDIAEDIVQETLLAAFKGRDRFSGKSTEKTWLIGILKHKVIDHYRKNKKEYACEDIEAQADNPFHEHQQWQHPPLAWNNPDASLEQAEFWKVLSQCISNLPNGLAELYILREIDGMSTKDICKVLDISTTNNMWVRLSRARMRLRQCLETHWFGPDNTEK